MDLIKKCEEMGMGSPWSCTVCSSAFAKLDKSVKQVISRVTTVETRADNLEQTTDSLKKEYETLREEMNLVKEKL